MTEKNQYKKTSVVVGTQNYNPTTKIYSWEVETHFYKTLPFTLEVYEKPQLKEGDWGKWYIVAQLDIANKQVGIRERDGEYGKSYTGTIIKKEFFVNLEKVLSRGDTDSYEVKFVEKDYWTEAGEEATPDLPF